jgi:nitrate/TMAO reductase-like tetraheme cytochrome c subunit
VQAKDRELREKQTMRDELTVKERELAETQQQLRQKVNSDNCRMCHVL